MASNIFLNVNPDFEMGKFVNQLANIYQSKGYTVDVAAIGANPVITISKGVGGINTILGLGQSIRVNCVLNGNSLNVSYSDAEWTSKIIGLAIGWIVCFIPLITAIVGAIGQYQLPDNISNDIRLIVANS